MKSTIYNSFRVYNISNMTVFSLASFLLSLTNQKM